MSKMLEYLKAAAGEATLMSRLGFWRQAVSLTVDQLVDLVQTLSGGGLLPATGTTQGSRPLSGYNTALGRASLRGRRGGLEQHWCHGRAATGLKKV